MDRIEIATKQSKGYPYNFISLLIDHSDPRGGLDDNSCYIFFILL
jgi:hypothetical protein